jgi:hypothetical protein
MRGFFNPCTIVYTGNDRLAVLAGQSHGCRPPPRGPGLAIRPGVAHRRTRNGHHRRTPGLDRPDTTADPRSAGRRCSPQGRPAPGGDRRGRRLCVTLPSLIVATCGGGTALPTQRQCLELLDCFGTGKADKLAEIVAAVALAGDISLASAVIHGDWVTSHERLGRNRP